MDFPETLYIIPFVKDTFWNKDYLEVLNVFKELDIPLKNVICVENTDIKNSFNNNFFKKIYELSGMTFIEIDLVEDNNVSLEGFSLLEGAISKRLEEKDYNMKIIMNPPYKRDLHLKVLNQMLTTFPDSEIVNLSPISWLQDPIAGRKSDSYWNRYPLIRKKLSELLPLSASEANQYFGIETYLSLGIYKLTQDGGYSFDIKDNILEKILNKKEAIGITLDKVKKVDKEKYFVLVNSVIPWHPERQATVKDKEGMFLKTEETYGRYYHKGVSDNGFTLEENKARNKRITRGTTDNYDCIIFDSKEEAINFVNFTKTKVFNYVFKKITVGITLYASYIPFMPDYTRPWTDKELYEYFELTEEEIKIIEDFASQNFK